MGELKPKTFNTTGVCVPSRHYMLTVLPRIPDVADMIEGEYYYTIHAPRQSGKSTFIEALTNKINDEGKYFAFYCSLASLRGMEDIESTMYNAETLIKVAVQDSEIEELVQLVSNYSNKIPLTAVIRIRLFLRYLSVNLTKDLVVFFDEADCLSGWPLVTFLAQIRDGYLMRHRSPKTKFPRSLALVGMRDIRDYLVQVRPDSASTGLASPFNVKKKALPLAHFTQEEIAALYRQHTEAT